MQFFYIYKALAHPETNGYVAPLTLDERLLHIQEARRTLGSAVPWICDTMQNDLKHALGDAPNSEFVIDPEGRVVKRRAWSDPQQLRKDLEQLIGPTARPTRIEDLHLRREPPPKVAKSGVVPRLRPPGRMSALKIEAVESKSPFYVKLRAEADEAWMRTGAGSILLGFHVDPLYRVHWNNLAAPVKFRVEAPEGVEVSPASGTGPKVEEAADVDPREFMLEVQGRSSEPLSVTVDYFACNDEEGWCKPVRQSYRVFLRRDADGGTTQGRGRSGGGGRPGGARGAGAGGVTVEATVVRVDVEGRRMTVRAASGGERAIEVARDAAIEREGRPIGLNDLSADDRLRMTVERAGPGRPVARRIETLAPR